ncbi:hypothetical protein K458DRAFT_163507 [Lentithecium fluviatile CBS 122367]|uniref:DUF7918 domain-containing protein n=1 Tax=Lentithecium fluviatile CBS 122367 TaxID=1168545 RepID=A0A6G1IGD0_9PLEO|nr:hypothetical protein K458DRAFT_163507 [Lentithecium fluviatile CBS 122367]
MTPPKSVIKYVETISGVRFEIHYAFTQPFPTQYGVRARIQLDGKKVRSQAWNQHELFAGEKNIKGIVSVQNGQDVRFPFPFSELHTEEDCVSSAIDGGSAAIEEITVEFDFVTNVRRRRQTKFRAT